MEHKLKQRRENIFRFDKIRQLKLLEIIQFSILSFLCGAAASILIDKLFDKLDKITPGKGLFGKKTVFFVLLEILLEMILTAFCYFYIKKILLIIPPWFSHKSFRAYTTVQYTLNFILTYTFINFNSNIKQNISYVLAAL